MPLDRDASQREILPIPDRPYVGPLMVDAKDPDSHFEPIQPIRPPKGSPNVVVILLDDVGFGASSAFGGPVHTPTAERLAQGGLKFNRFHTTALCTPTRAALLTGRNHHSVGMGNITELATSAPGNDSMIPNSAASIAKVLQCNGYATAQFGKCHEVPVWESGPIGPFKHWPIHQGFEKFYGFVAGETNQYYPTLYDGTTHIDVPDDENYHLTEDLADQATHWIRTQKALAPDKPFLVYFAPGATHAPHQAPEEWVEKYKGQFDDGWDALRDRTFARQKELGVIPQDAELTKRHAQIPSWEEMPDELKPVLRREMEVYAGFLSHTDHQVGRLIDTLERLEILDNTIVLYILGDNGASAEGTLNGTFNEMINFNGAEEFESPELLISHLDDLGGKKSYNHYAVGWAHAMCAPYQWTKQVASHFGGTRNGMVMHWPQGIQERGGLRSQFTHVIDVFPTILEAIGLPQPVMVDGVQQKPIEGTSFLYALGDAKAPERHTTQYFEMFGNRGIYHQGWTAVTHHATPWIMFGEKTPAFDDDVWELYDTTRDWTQAKDLAKERPDMLKKLQTLWLIEAARHNVLPLDDRKSERLIARDAGRPLPVEGNRQLFFDGMFVSAMSVIDNFSQSFALTAEITLPETGARGVILAQGNDFGGYGLYCQGGKLTYVYNFMGLETYKVQAPDALPPGDHQVRMEFAYDGGGLGKGGTVTLFLDGNPIAEGYLPHTNAIIFNTDAVLMVGDKSGGPLCDDIPVGGNRFSGKVHWALIEVSPDEPEHYISPEEQLRLLMAIQ